jgi:hypothetical protein
MLNGRFAIASKRSFRFIGSASQTRPERSVAAATLRPFGNDRFLDRWLTQSDPQLPLFIDALAGCCRCRGSRGHSDRTTNRPHTFWSIHYSKTE